MNSRAQNYMPYLEFSTQHDCLSYSHGIDNIESSDEKSMYMEKSIRWRIGQTGLKIMTRFSMLMFETLHDC